MGNCTSSGGGGGATAQQQSVMNKISQKFPVGASGINKFGGQGSTITEARKKKATAETRLKKLEKAHNEVKGTGKTQRELNAEKRAKAEKAASKTMAWKTMQKGGWNNGGYSPKIISAGDFQIHGESGFYSVYKNGKLIGRTNKLSSAKAYAEKAK